MMHTRQRRRRCVEVSGVLSVGYLIRRSIWVCSVVLDTIETFRGSKGQLPALIIPPLSIKRFANPCMPVHPIPVSAFQPFIVQASHNESQRIEER